MSEKCINILDWNTRENVRNVRKSGEIRLLEVGNDRISAAFPITRWSGGKHSFLYAIVFSVLHHSCKCVSSVC